MLPKENVTLQVAAWVGVDEAEQRQDRQLRIDGRSQEWRHPTATLFLHEFVCALQRHGESQRRNGKEGTGASRALILSSQSVCGAAIWFVGTAPRRGARCGDEDEEELEMERRSCRTESATGSRLVSPPSSIRA